MVSRQHGEHRGNIVQGCVIEAGNNVQGKFCVDETLDELNIMISQLIIMFL